VLKEIEIKDGQNSKGSSRVLPPSENSAVNRQAEIILLDRFNVNLYCLPAFGNKSGLMET
jgi:hypothetical protein